MGEALILFLRTQFEPPSGDDLVSRLHFGGEDALAFVLDACQGKKDAVSLGLANFAYCFKIDMGVGSEEHKEVIDEMMNVTKNLSYEGQIGFAALRGMQCVSFEAEDIFAKAAKGKDATGSD